MDRRYRLGIVSLVLVVLAGAGVYVFIAGQNAHSSDAYLQVVPAEGNVSANETVAFEQLSPAQGDLFERARNTTEIVEIPPDLDYGVFVDNRYVQYRNRTDETAVMVG